MAEEIVASRVLICKRASQPEFEVTVSLTKPFHHLESDSWQTICVFEGGELKDQMTVTGQDSLQSLLLAIRALETKLTRYKKIGYAMYLYGEPFNGFAEKG
jgi:hypothetical protein